MILNCKKCGLDKESSEFHKYTRSKTGHKDSCKDCRRGIDNKRKLDAYYANKKKFADNHKNWQKTNKDHYNAYMREWNKKNKDYSTAQNREYRATCRAKLLQATPKWGDRNKVKVIYKLAKQLQEELGIKLHVDHIAPLQGKTATGLHVWYNLRILPSIVNFSKCNKIDENIILARVPDNFEEYLNEVENICRTYANQSVRSNG